MVHMPVATTWMPSRQADGASASQYTASSAVRPCTLLVSELAADLAF